MRLLCYIMETNYTEALTPICISLTNLAERQLHGKDAEAGVAGKSKLGGQPPVLAGWRLISVHSPPELPSISPSPGTTQHLSNMGRG